MAKELDADELRKKFEKWRNKVSSIVNQAAKENLDVGARKKEDLSKIYGEVERAGLNLSAFKKAMTFLDHITEAVGVRGDVIASEDTDKLLAFDRFLVAGEDGMPLFDAATVKEIKKNAVEAAKPKQDDEPEEAEADPDDGKVTRLHPEQAASA